MKDTKKLSLKIAGALIALGLLVITASFAALDFDIKRMGTTMAETHTYSVKESFRDISIGTDAFDVRLVPSEDTRCRVVCTESDKIRCRVKVEDNTLRIESVDKRRWYEHIGWFVNINEMEITVFLPQSQYGSLHVRTLSGSVEVPEAFAFTEAEVDTSSGRISFTAAVDTRLQAETTSGSIHAGNTAPQTLSLQSTSGAVTLDTVEQNTRLQVRTTSGKIKMQNIRCGTVDAESTSGAISLSELYAGRIQLSNVSGAVELQSCDADSLCIKTVSGKVSGRLATEKLFITDTVSGSVDVPLSQAGGSCEVETTSGDIKFTVG